MSWRTDRPTEGFTTSYLPDHPNLPVRMFLPTDYQPKYPYPLVVLFHGHGASEDHAARLAPQLSRRNYVCLSLRGPRSHGPQPDGRPAFGWDAASPAIEDYWLAALDHARQAYRVHTDRVYLIGVCEGAAVAYQLAISHPERVAGVIALNGRVPVIPTTADLTGLRVFAAHGTVNPVVPFAEARKAVRRLTAAGAGVRLTGYPVTHRVHPDMLRDANRWIMDRVNTETATPLADG